jgi:RNA recognition motif-containing protein
VGGSRPIGYLHRLEQQATTFFFSNIPEDTKEVDLLHRFGRFGRVVDVYIPSKVDKQGRRFGFVKFREVTDATELLRSIFYIWFGSYKVRVNRYQFGKYDKPNANEPRPEVGRSVQNFIQKGRSYKGALAVTDMEEGQKGKGGWNAGVKGNEVQPSPVESPSKQEVVWEVEVEDEVLAKLGGA